MELKPTPAEAARIYAVSFHRETKETREFDVAEIEEELGDAEVFSWINVQGPDIQPLNDILRRLGIDLVLVSHFGAPEVLPRIVETPECLAFYLYEVEDPELHLDTSRELREIEVVRLILVLGTDFVLTYHRRDVETVAYVKSQCIESFRMWGKTPGFIAFLFLQRCLYDYAHLNLANDNFLDRMEENLLAGDPQELREEISLAGRNILTLKKLAASLHIVLMLLGNKRSVFISEQSRAFYNEMMQSAVAVRAAIDSSRDMLDGILAAIQAEATQRTGEIARVLTVVSAIILPLSLVTGVYGMNFEHMPELKTPLGYFFTLGFMGVLALCLLLAFRRLGWLGRSRRL